MAIKKGECLHIRISEELKLQAEKIASQSNQTLSDWLRDLIKRAVWREEMERERRIKKMEIVRIQESDHITFDRNGMHHTGREALFEDGRVLYEFEDEDGNLEYLN